MRKTLALIFSCVFISGCSEPFWIFMSPSEKITHAFPPGAEVRISEEGLRQALRSDSDKIKNFEHQYAAKLELRALTCSQGQNIGRFDSIKVVATKPIDKDCLATQDQSLLQFLGSQRVGMRLAQGPQYPLTPFDQQTPMANGGLPDHRLAATASHAGVGILQGSRNEFVSIQIPSGKKIATLAPIAEYSQSTILSPNGRVAAIRSGGQRLIFSDTENGEKLWETSEYSQFHAWLPEVAGALLQEKKNNRLVLIDFQTGLVHADISSLTRQSWAIRIEEQAGHILVGDNREFSHLAFSRAGDQIQVNAIKTYHLTQGQGVTSTTPTLMRQGKTVFFVSNLDFMSVDLETGAEKLWGTTDFLLNRYAKLNENQVIVSSAIKGDYRTKPWVLDIEQATLAPINQEKYRGVFSDLKGRTGFLRRDTQTWLGDSVEVGPPEPLEGLISAFNLERQLAKLERDTQSAMLNPITSRPVFGSSQMTAGKAASEEDNALIAALARNAQIEAIGVYEGADVAGRRTNNGRKQGEVNVTVRASSKPIVLALSSYEPVRWNIRMEAGARMPLILVSGYHPSEVVGAGSARVFNTGNEYAYKFDSPEYERLKNSIRKQIGTGINAFQGKYQGSNFSVGG